MESKRLILMTSSTCPETQSKSKSKRIPVQSLILLKFRLHAYFALTQKIDPKDECLIILILQFLKIFLSNRLQMKTSFIQPHYQKYQIFINNYFIKMAGGENLDAGQQANQGYQQPNYGQQPNQHGQPGNVQINIGTRNPPPPPAGGRNHHLGGVHIHIGDYPIDVRKCPRCVCDTETVVRYKYGSLVWIMCLVLFCFSICLFWIPFCIDEWKDKEYHCARCGSIKGFRKGHIC